MRNSLAGVKRCFFQCFRSLLHFFCSCFFFSTDGDFDHFFVLYIFFYSATFSLYSVNDVYYVNDILAYFENLRNPTNLTKYFHLRALTGTWKLVQRSIQAFILCDVWKDT